MKESHFVLAVPTSVRVSLTVDRTAKMVKGNVCPEAIAVQMTYNSSNGHTYTEDDVKAFCKLYEDCQSRVLVTKPQATAFLNDAKDSADDLSLA